MPTPYVYPISAVEAIHDGDSMVITIDLGFDTIRRTSVRLSGLDTPEVVGVSKAAGIAVRDYLRKLISTVMPRVLTLESRALDKYGRSLGTIHVAGCTTTINDMLVKRGMALAYDGGGSRAGTWTPALLAKAIASATAAPLTFGDA